MASDRVLYANNPDWTDIQPIPQHDTVVPVAPIFYTDEYKDATSYFRAIVQAKEYSPRVLDLTLHIISINPGHYTVWQYRWATLLALKSDLQPEQTLMEEIATKHLKTYQVWHHRRLLLTHLKNPLPELIFLNLNLQIDNKNYHTWAYRQWILSHFGAELGEEEWEKEMEFVDEMIADDVRNNSAWHHRFFVVWLSGVRSGEEDRSLVLRNDLRYVKTKISIAPTNLSAWNYLRGILDHTKTPYNTLIPFVTPYTSSTFHPSRTSEIDTEDPGPSQVAQLPCSYAIEFLADAIAKDGEKDPKEAIELYKGLAEEHDKTRKNFWNYRVSELTQLSQLQASAA